MTKKTLTLPPLARVGRRRPLTMTAVATKRVAQTTPARKKLRNRPRSARLKRSLLHLPKRLRLTKTLGSRTSLLAT
jgi:hypothetical protein